MIANGLSLARMLLAPIVAFSLYHDGHGASPLTLALMLTAGATDLLDGWAARRLGQTSALGRILDPLADKLFIGSVCVCLVLLRGFPLWLLLLQAVRDVAIVGVGGTLLRSRQLVIGASLGGKVATWVMALTMLGHVLQVGAPWSWLSYGLSAAAIVSSGAGYAWQLRTLLQSDPEPQAQPPSASAAPAGSSAPSAASACNRTEA